MATSSQSGKEGPLVAISYQVYVEFTGEARLEHPIGAQFVVVGLVLIAACGRVDAVDPKYVKLTFYIIGNFFPMPPFKKWLISYIESVFFSL